MYLEAIAAPRLAELLIWHETGVKKQLLLGTPCSCTQRLAG